MSTYTINDEQVRNFHNALCDLNLFKQRMEDTLSKDALNEFYRAYNAFSEAFKPVREEADRRWEEKYEHYSKVREMNNLKSIWSMFEVDNVFDLSGLQAEKLIYEDHWGGKQVTVNLPGGNLQFWDLWKAAEEAIINSNDTHHIFIEKFVKKEDNNLYLVTGS